MNKTIVFSAEITALYKPSTFERIYCLVSDKRREKTDKMRFTKDKCLSLGADYLLINACREFGTDYYSEVIQESSYGKPFFVSESCCFNISHSGERVLCAISENPVGCDLEQKKPVDLTIAKRFFTEKEFQYIMNENDQDTQIDLFYRIWTLKESFQKCTGFGFSLPLNDFTISFSGNQAEVLYPEDNRKYIFSENTSIPGYHCSCCVQAHSAVAFQNIEWQEIEIS